MNECDKCICWKCTNRYTMDCDQEINCGQIATEKCDNFLGLTEMEGFMLIYGGPFVLVKEENLWKLEKNLPPETSIPDSIKYLDFPTDLPIQ